MGILPHGCLDTPRRHNEKAAYVFPQETMGQRNESLAYGDEIRHAEETPNKKALN